LVPGPAFTGQANVKNAACVETSDLEPLAYIGDPASIQHLACITSFRVNSFGHMSNKTSINTVQYMAQSVCSTSARYKKSIVHSWVWMTSSEIKHARTQNADQGVLSVNDSLHQPVSHHSFFDFCLAGAILHKHTHHNDDKHYQQ